MAIDTNIQGFIEINNKLDPQRKKLLARRINELSLKIQGTSLENLIIRLYGELDKVGIIFKPRCYLSDEWGCPQGIPAIGIPFYLADKDLSLLEGEMTGIEAENEEETMMYLRHEAGHAFNYAYNLYQNEEWQMIFGQFSKPYNENYNPLPFDSRFVRHLPGWYAQKHPDEDFAETFAVILAPESNWRKKYENTPAIDKLAYVNRTISEYGQKLPIIDDLSFDTPVEELTDTLAAWYYASNNMDNEKIDLPLIINEDLKILFPSLNGNQASSFILGNRQQLLVNIHQWTGAEKQTIDNLINSLIQRVESLNLKVGPNQDNNNLVGLTAFMTTLITNHLRSGKFVPL